MQISSNELPINQIASGVDNPETPVEIALFRVKSSVRPKRLSPSSESSDGATGPLNHPTEESDLE